MSFFKGIIKARPHTNLDEVGCFPESIFLEEVAHFTNATTKYIKLEDLEGWEGQEKRFAQKSLVLGDYYMRMYDLYQYDIMVKEVLHETRIHKLVLVAVFLYSF